MDVLYRQLCALCALCVCIFAAPKDIHIHCSFHYFLLLLLLFRGQWI